MKKLIMLTFVFAITFNVNAQIKSPQASTLQTINQMVGLTNIELSYSRTFHERKNNFWRFGTL